MKIKTKALLFASLAWASVAPASAAVVFLNYEGVGLGDTDPVANAYAGIGIVHAGGAKAAVDGGGTFDFDNEPTSDTVMYYDSTAYINIAAGFDTGLSLIHI